MRDHEPVETLGGLMLTMGLGAALIAWMLRAIAASPWPPPRKGASPARLAEAKRATEELLRFTPPAIRAGLAVATIGGGILLIGTIL
jgi:hypothetical protein